MSEVARLVGMEQRSYEKDGKQREYCGLHLMYVENSVEGVRGSKVENSVEGVRGSKVEVLSCPQRVDPRHLKVGALYELGYSFFQTRQGKMARLSDLQVVEE